MSPEIPIVFVVDDDRSVGDSLRRLITSVGMSVEVFPTAQAFLSTPRGDTPGCLVLDVRLPGLSGLDLQRELANTNATLPIIFLSGHGRLRAGKDVRAERRGGPAAQRHDGQQKWGHIGNPGSNVARPF
jgi:FixJ family two-component response regulator